jgi:hypothetical protein
VLTATRSLETETIHKLQLERLWDLASIHIITILLNTTTLQLILIPGPLICDCVSTAHTPDGNNHLGLPSEVVAEIKF